MLRADHCGRTLSSFLSSLAEIAGCDDGWLYYCISGSHGVCSGQRTTVTQLHCCWLLLHHCTGLHSSTLQPELGDIRSSLGSVPHQLPADLHSLGPSHLPRHSSGHWSLVTGVTLSRRLGSPQHHDCARLLANWNYFPPLKCEPQN